MKKALILVLLMVLCLGSAALAAETKLGGEIRYYFVVPGDDSDALSYAQLRLKANATLNERTSALINLKADKLLDANGAVIYLPDECYEGENCDVPYSDVKFAIVTAELIHKIPGAGTIAAGVCPDYGSNPFQFYNTVWGAQNKDLGISFASESFGGVAFQGFYSPKRDGDDETSMSGEATFTVPNCEAQVGVAIAKDQHDDASWALIGSVPVVKDVLTVYGEYGKTGDDCDEDEFDIRAIGAKAVLGKATLYGEGNVEAKQYQLQATYPVQGVSLNAAYKFGEGYGSADDGKITFWAKVAF